MLRPIINIDRVETAARCAANQARGDVDRWHLIRNGAFRAMVRQRVDRREAFVVACDYADATYAFAGWSETWENAREILGWYRF
jgi:hypothetical protein